MVDVEGECGNLGVFLCRGGYSTFGEEEERGRKKCEGWRWKKKTEDDFSDLCEALKKALSVEGNSENNLKSENSETSESRIVGLNEEIP